MMVTLFRIVVLLLAGGGLALAVAYLAFDAQMRGEVGRLEGAAQPTPGLVTAEMVAALPAPAQRYLIHAGVVGQPIPRLVKVTQTGRIRGSTDASWMEFAAVETYSTSPPGFVWRAWFPSQMLPVALGRDAYLDGEGSILMRMLALWPLADEHGEPLRAAALMRYLNEMMWFPAAFLGSNVTISARDDGSFGVAIADRGLTAEGVLFVDADGRPTNFQAQRFNTATRSVETWETPLGAEAALAGLRLPGGGAAVWKLAGGDFTYIELTVSGVSYTN